MKTLLVYLFVALLTSCQSTSETTEKEEITNKVIVADSTQNFEWTYGMCHFSGTFLPSEVSKETLERTSQLYFSGVKLAGDPTEFIPKLKEIVYKKNEISFFLNELKSEFEQQEAVLKNNVINTDYWRNLQSIRLKELREEYALKRTLMEGYLNPEVIVKSSFAKNCTSYVTPLVAKDSAQTMLLWQQITDKQMVQNGNPADVEATFLAQQSSVHKWLFAQESLLIFGWYNCANEQRVYWQNDDEVQAQFARLFVQIKKTCDD